MAVDINAMRKSQSTVAIDLVNDKFTEKMSNIQLLDYIALVLARNMASNIAFKGGWVLRQIMEGHASATKDVDLSAETEKSYDEVKAVLKEIGQLLQARGMIDEFVIKEEIKPTQSGGITMYKDGSIVAGVDVGLHNIHYGVHRYELNYGFDAFTIERMLSDKILAILTRKHFRRTKDLYDVYAISHVFDFSSQKIVEFMKERGVTPEWDNIPFSAVVLEQYEIAWNKLRVQAISTDVEVEKPSFTAAISTFNEIAYKVKEIWLGQDSSVYEWNHNNCGWSVSE